MSQEPCGFDPRTMAGQPIGMFHCPECGEMVIAGMAHPDYANWEEDHARYMAELEAKDLEKQ